MYGIVRPSGEESSRLWEEHQCGQGRGTKRVKMGQKPGGPLEGKTKKGRGKPVFPGESQFPQFRALSGDFSHPPR